MDARPFAEPQKAFEKLRAEMTRLGLNRKRPSKVLMEAGMFACLLAASILLMLSGASFVAVSAGAVGVLLGTVGLATNAHTSAHGATSDRPWLNSFLTWLGFSVVSSISTTYWRHKHNVLHHQHPNEDLVDPDHEFTPHFALAEPQEERLSVIARKLRPLQAFLFPLATGFLIPNMASIGAVHTLKVLGKSKFKDSKAVIDLAGLVLSVLAWWVVPLFFASPLRVLMLNTVRLVAGSYIFFAIFAPAHLPHEASFFPKGGLPKDWFSRQMATTLNFRAFPVARVFLSGLSYQIEHHLFPGVPHHQLPRIAPLVRKACEEAGIPYRELSWHGAVWKCVLVGYRPKRLANLI